MNDSELCSKVLTMPDKTYLQLQEKVNLIINLRNKYFPDDEDEEQSEWDKFEKEEKEMKWNYFVQRSLQPIYDIW